MLPILLYTTGQDQAAWAHAFKIACPQLDIRPYPDWGDSDEPSYAYLWKPEHGLVAKYPNIKVIFYGGAGVDHLLTDPTLPPDIPIVRLSDEGLKNGMADWVLMNILMHQRHMPTILENAAHHEWRPIVPTLPEHLTVGIMGYGALGKCCAAKIKPFGFKINSWSNSPKPEEEHVTHYQGIKDFSHFLQSTNILVSLLPATIETDNLLNKKTLSCLPKGAAIINAGRGNVLDTTALLDKISSGKLSGASLDVFQTEPLPKDSPLWDCKRIIITPHIAAHSRIETAADYVIKAIKTYETLGTLENILKKDKGY